MGVRSATEAITRQEWLAAVEETLQHGIHEAFRSGGATGQKIKNALHGTWLGHSLHAALTDIPIGAWTAAVVFDVIDITTDRRQWGVAADASLNLGIRSTLAAVAGLTDWQDTDPPVRRIGLMQPELRDGTMRRVEYQGAPILLARLGNRLFALAENCSHWGGPLSERKIIDDSVKCPWHGSRFALEDGRVLDGPAVHPQLCLRARIRNGQIEIGKVVTPSEIPLAPCAAVEESHVR